MRPLCLVLLAGCTGTTAPRRAPPLQLDVRLAEARHASQVDLDVFVWPTAAPTDPLPSGACDWWADRQGGRTHALAGLNDGSLGWGAVHITRDQIGVGGADVVPLDQGRLEDGQVDGANVPLLYTRVVEARRVLDAWYETCGEVYRDRPLLVVDADVPQTTVNAVLSTLARARFPRVAALVGDRDPTNATAKAADQGVLAVIRQEGPAVEIMDSTGLIRLTGPVEDSESMLAKATANQRFGCALVVPAPQAAWADVAGTIDTTTAFGSAASLIADAGRFAYARGWTPGPAAPAREGRQPTEWLSLDNTAAVHWIDLPDLEWSPEPKTVRCADLHGPVRQKVAVAETLNLAVERLPNPTARVCTRLACGMAPPIPAEVEEARVDVGWSTYGPLELGSPTAPIDTIIPTMEALAACPPPPNQGPGTLRRVLAWVEVDPDGTPREILVEHGSGDRRAAWSACLLEALRSWPVIPTGKPHHHAVVELRIESTTPP